jgi:hypothetical protein
MRDHTPACRFCGAALKHIVLDLGEHPLANSFLTETDLQRPEPRYRLCVRVCDDCFLVQTDTTVPPDMIFSDYAYSSYRTPHRPRQSLFEAMTALGRRDSRVIEVASKDGYLLKNFVARGILCLA